MRIVLAILLASCRLHFDVQQQQDVDSAGEPIALVQTASDACGPCSSLTVTPPRPVTSTNLLVAMVYTCAPPDGGCPTPALDDTLGTTWIGPTIVGSLGEGANYFWYACGVSGGDDAFTVGNGTSYGISLQVHEVHGIAPQACLDTFGTRTGMGSPAAVAATASVTRPDGYVVAFFGTNANAGATSFLAGPGYTTMGTTSNPFGDVTMSEVADAASVAGIQSATAVDTNPGSIWQATIATFLAP